MSKQEKADKYEEVAKELMHRFREQLGFERVEGKQPVAGQAKESWVIDAKGIIEDGEKFAIIECRRKSRDGITAEEMGGIAYRVKDTGAITAWTVGPKPVQSGAQEIADYENYKHVILDPDSSADKYLMQFLGKTFWGVVEEIGVSITERVEIVARDKDGNIVDHRLHDSTRQVDNDD